MRLLKVIFFVAVNASLLKTAKAAETDTARFYFTFNLNLVDSPSKADFVRMIFPSDGQENYVNVIEYYRNGNIKMVGKSQAGLPRTFVNGEIVLEGNCINYYPSGKRQSIVNYIKGMKDGMEYIYRESGGLNFTQKYVLVTQFTLRKRLYWDFYDEAGIQICKSGNGQWVRYDEDGNIQEQGAVKNGLPEGEWKGIHHHLSINYTRNYHNGKLISSTGFDQTGKAYPFTTDFQQAYYNKEDPDYFIEILHNKFKIPKDANGVKVHLDTIHFSFIIEKNGRITNAGILESKDTLLNNSLNEALQNGEKWSPIIYYGVPVRTKMYFAYKERVDYKTTEVSGNETTTTIKGISYDVEVVGP